MWRKLLAPRRWLLRVLPSSSSSSSSANARDRHVFGSLPFARLFSSSPENDSQRLPLFTSSSSPSSSSSEEEDEVRILLEAKGWQCVLVRPVPGKDELEQCIYVPPTQCSLPLEEDTQQLRPSSPSPPPSTEFKVLTRTTKHNNRTTSTTASTTGLGFFFGHSSEPNLSSASDSSQFPFSRFFSFARVLSLRRVFVFAQTKLVQTYLPQGYPTSVGGTFLVYCIWQFAHNVLGSAASVLSMQALLYALGIGAGSVPLAATINWVLKDGLGQFGGMVYGALFGTKFDHNPKRYRFLSVLMYQASTLLEAATPLFPHMFLALASLANVGKNISFIAGSASRAQIHNSFALNHNLGDITAKIASQSIVSGILGTGLGIMLSHLIGSNPSVVVLSVFPVSLLTVVAAYNCSKCVVFSHLDFQRSQIVFSHLVARLPLQDFHSGERETSCPHLLQQCHLHVLSPSEVALEHERFLRTPETMCFGVHLSAPATLQHVASQNSRFYHLEGYSLIVAPRGEGKLNSCLLFLNNEPSFSTFVRAFLHTTLVCRALRSLPFLTSPPLNAQEDFPHWASSSQNNSANNDDNMESELNRIVSLTGSFSLSCHQEVAGALLRVGWSESYFSVS